LFYCVLFFSGQHPAEAELNFVENAKKLAMYGVHIHEAKVRDKPEKFSTIETLLIAALTPVTQMHRFDLLMSNVENS